MQRFGIRHVGAMLSLVLVFGLLAAGIGVVRAQDTDVTVDGPGTPRPGHIHSGSCAELGDVVYAFNNATVDNLDQDYESTGDVAFAGSEDASPVYVSETTIEDVTLDDILAADHAINFHLSGDEISTYITCGDIGGFVRDGQLYVGLVPTPEYPDTAFAGTAILTDNGDDTVTVLVQFVELPATDGTTDGTTGGTTADVATPVATPVAADVDASVEASADASVEASADASVAPSADASADASVEASADASVEASADASVEASADASVEASADASIEASVEPEASESPAA